MYSVSIIQRWASHQNLIWSAGYTLDQRAVTVPKYHYWTFRSICACYLDTNGCCNNTRNKVYNYNQCYLILRTLWYGVLVWDVLPSPVLTGLEVGLVGRLLRVAIHFRTSTQVAFNIVCTYYNAILDYFYIVSFRCLYKWK